MSRPEKMSPIDTAWLRMGNPNNLMQIVGVMLFEGDLDFDRLRQTIERRLLAFDRFRQVVRRQGARYHWVEDGEFDLDQHLRRAVLPGRGGKAELERFVADLASTALHPGRPLWEMHVVDTALGGQALIMRIHHCIGDGIALVRVIMSLADESAALPESSTGGNGNGAGEEAAHEHFPFSTFWQPVTQALQTSWALSSTLWDKYRQLVTDPEKAMAYARLGGGMTVEAVKLLLMPSDSPTRFKGTPGSVKRVAWSEPLPLPEIKAVGKALGCSVNDLLLSSVAGALRAYLRERGDPTDGVEVRAMVPVNLRQPKDKGKLGNRFGMVTLELPVGEANPLARLYETRRRMLARRHSPQPLLILGVQAVAGMGPHLVEQELVNYLAAKATAVMTNVPGPTEAIYLAGARLRQPFFWVPQSGSIGMGISILSYNHQVQFGLITDKSMVPDPDRIVSRFAQEFQKLMLLVLMGPLEHLHDPELIEAHYAAYWPTP